MIKLSQREKMIAGACLLACLAFAGQRLYGRFQEGGGVDPLTQERVLIRKIAQAREVMAQGRAYDQRFRRVVEALGSVSPDGVEMSRITSAIDMLARQSRVRVVNVKPLAPQDEEFTRRYAVEVVFDGDWQALAGFIHRAQAADSFFYISRMEITKFSEEMRSLQSRMTLTRYRVKPFPELK